jgi:hypothetical protein
MMNALRVGEDSETRRLGGDASFGFLRSRARREQPVRNIERGLPCREGEKWTRNWQCWTESGLINRSSWRPFQ